jgi:hypothetical protein
MTDPHEIIAAHLFGWSEAKELNWRKAETADQSARSLVEVLAENGWTLTQTKAQTETEVFLVMTNRKGSGLPTVEKAANSEMFLTQESAASFLERITAEIGPHFGIYKAVITVEYRMSGD